MAEDHADHIDPDDPIEVIIVIISSSDYPRYLHRLALRSSR